LAQVIWLRGEKHGTAQRSTEGLLLCYLLFFLRVF